jgi:hypothetical protein
MSSVEIFWDKNYGNSEIALLKQLSAAVNAAFVGRYVS